MKLILILLQFHLLKTCKIDSEFETPQFFEGLGFLSSDDLIVYNSCHLHSTHCKIFKNSFNLSQKQWSKSQSNLDPGFGFTWLYSSDLFIFSGRSVDGSLLPGLSQVKDGKKSVIDLKSPSKPKPRSSACMARFSHFLILFAGESMTGEEENDFWIFDLRSKEWQQIVPKGFEGFGRKGHSCLVYEQDSLFLVFGGVARGNYLNDLMVFRVLFTQKGLIFTSALSEFEVLGNLPRPREGASFVMIDRRPMISSGCNYKEAECFGDIFFLTVEQSSILVTEVKVNLPKQEKVLIVPDVHRFFVVPGHSKNNKQEKKSFVVSCSTACSNNGILINAVCICNSMFFGESCEFKCVHGRFVTGQCICDSGFALPDCEYTIPQSLIQTSSCSHNCHNRGTCLNNECHCLPEYFGISCELKYCSSNCGSNKNQGACDHSSGLCKCQSKFGGSHCEHFCPEGCPSGHECQNNNQCICKDCGVSCSQKGTLVDGVCHCLQGYCGATCEQLCEDCHGHGKFTGKCECFDGYFGVACQASCPNLCSGQGICNEGLCECRPGWEGQDCGIENDCKKCLNGRCVDGKCRCFKGFSGDSCNEEVCPNNCTVIDFHFEVRGEKVRVFKTLEDLPDTSDPVVEVLVTAGLCLPDKKICQCFPGFWGSDCSKSEVCEKCLQGTCENHKCRCFPGFSGEFCDLSECPSSCSNHGECISGKCSCYPLWSGPACSACLCKQGTCLSSHCECFPGYEGQFCEVRTCEKCIHGICADFSCHCEKGFSGKYCEVCDDCFNCQNHLECGLGKCIERKCQCPKRTSGKFCEVEECSGHGDKNGEDCVCDKGFFGKDCSISQECKNNCSFHGVCHLGKCFCEPGYENDDCSLNRDCPDNCNFNGKCVRGKCFCFHGFFGPACLPEKVCENCPCPCVAGKCLCQKVKEAVIEMPVYNMIQSECPQNCNNHGQCIHNTCVCDENWQGEFCEILEILDNSRFCMKNGKECSGHGLCNNGRCFCEKGFSGDLCESQPCDDCKGLHQSCVQGTCQCLKGWSGKECSVPDDCSFKDCGKFGNCVSGKCLCEYGYTSDGFKPCSLAVMELGTIALVISIVYGLVIYTILRLNPKIT